MNTNIFEDIVNKVLKEYSSDQRLPFDDDEFKNKNYLEQYTDWLEDFGKYGELPPSKLDFWKELEKAAKYIVGTNLHGRFDNGLYGESPEKVLSDLSKNMKNNLQFNENGNLYVERKITLDESANYYNKSDEKGSDPTQLYKMLIKKYNSNVGGCWSYKQDASRAYCAEGGGSDVVLKGYIRIDDIDFVKTILLNFNYEGEYEIRVKPKAKVELTEVVFDCRYKIPLKGHLIVNATYFGNNSGYKGDYAPVDDGFGNITYMDRNDNISNFVNVSKQIRLNGDNLEDVFTSVTYLDSGFVAVKYYNKYTLVTPDNKLINNGNLWFDYFGEFRDGFAVVKKGDKYSYISEYGKFIGNGNLWFDDANPFNDGFAVVRLNGKYNFIKTDGHFINNNLWGDHVFDFEQGHGAIQVNDLWYIIDTNGNILGDGINFDDVFEITKDYVAGDCGDKMCKVDFQGNYYDYMTDEPIPNPINDANENRKYIKKIIKETINKYLYNNLVK